MKTHPEDLLLKQIQKKWGEEIGRQKYSDGGRGDAAKIAETIKALPGFRKDCSVIDYASGFGRVARNLGEFLPESDICAVDIHEKAVSFMEELGLKTALSTELPYDTKALNIPNADFIYCMSFFSHLNAESFSAWLKYLLTKSNQYLIITVNGIPTLKRFPAFYGKILNLDTGHGFRTESDQPDLNDENYGSAIVTSKFISDILNETNSHLLYSVTPGKWFGSQDEYVFVSKDLYNQFL